MGLPRRGGADNRRLLLPLAGCSAIVGFALLFATGCGGHERTSNPPIPHATEEPAAPAQSPTHKGDSIVATATTRRVAVYRSPHARHPFLWLENPTSVREPLVFLVRRLGRDRVQVYVPVRPDGTTGWVANDDLSLAWDPYSVQVRIRAHRLILRKHGRVVSRYKAAVGRSVLPTPKGRYYIVDLLKQPDPHGLYGPYAFGTSAFSHVLYSFGGGPGQIGIHGTNDPASIGRSASHGCVRIPNAAITALAHRLPLGTPVTIGD